MEGVPHFQIVVHLSMYKNATKRSVMNRKWNVLLVVMPVFCIALACHSQKKITATTHKIPEEYDGIYTNLQRTTFQYFWDGAEPNSGMGRERFHVDNVYPENDKNIVTTGGSGFGIMGILVGIERGFIT